MKMIKVTNNEGRVIVINPTHIIMVLEPLDGCANVVLMITNGHYVHLHAKHIFSEISKVLFNV